MDKCETCVFYLYDEEYDDYVCDMDLDEDEMVRFLASTRGTAPSGGPETSIAPRAGSKSAVSCSRCEETQPNGCVSFFSSPLDKSSVPHPPRADKAESRHIQWIFASAGCSGALRKPIRRAGR